MPERPLLILPRSRTLPRIPRPSQQAEKYQLPNRDFQSRILTPRFDRMIEAFISETPAGTSPENILVLETVGKLEDFKAAVRAIPGLAWIAEIDVDEIEAGEDFSNRLKIGPRFFINETLGIDSGSSKQIVSSFSENNFFDEKGFLKESITESNIKNAIPDEFEEIKEQILHVINSKRNETLSGRVYLSLTNRQALQEIKSLFDNWVSNRSLPHGKGAWKNIFSHLKNVRFWGVEDRVRDTGIIDYWENEVELKRGTSSRILFDIELYYLNEDSARAVQQRIVEDLVAAEGGVINARCHIAEIKFHALKVELPVDSIDGFLSGNYSNLFKSNGVFVFRPSTQCIIKSVSDGTADTISEFEEPIPEPIIALLDGYPMARHKLLEKHLIIDDPDEFGTDYQPREQSHGTGMASLICHGELDANEPPLKRKVYVRPILKPDEDSPLNPRPEKVPKNIFFEDLLEIAVRRIFEATGDAPAQAPTVRIINLSIGDSNQMFHQLLSPAARLVDWLSYRYKVLFCVSAGNINNDVELNIIRDDFLALNDDEKIKHTISFINNNKRNRKLLSPSESINALTIGALHSDTSVISTLGSRIDILPTQILPSPFSALGHGFRSSIKPDILLSGGRQLYDHVQDGLYETNDIPQAPGQKVAGASTNPGDVTRTLYTRGTSNATALASRSAGMIYDALELMFDDYHIDFPDDVAPVIKALLVHSATWGKSRDLLIEALNLSENARIIKNEIARYLGYGIPDINKSIECSYNRATAVGFGKISKDVRHEYRFPLPLSLSGMDCWRKLTITLAWLSPINIDNRNYRRAALAFEASGIDDMIGGSRHEAWWQQVRNGTIQHEVIEGKQVKSYQNGDELVIPVQCREDAGPLNAQVPYGLAVSLEVKENVDIPIYDEIRESIDVILEEQITERIS